MALIDTLIPLIWGIPDLGVNTLNPYFEVLYLPIFKVTSRGVTRDKSPFAVDN